MGVVSRISQIVCLIMCVYGMWLIAEDIYDRINRRYHRRKVDARIIKQAKELGVWDDGLNFLRGRALELKAREDFGIKREPGETDAQLRRRCMAAADNELANTPREGENE